MKSLASPPETPTVTVRYGGLQVTLTGAALVAIIVCSATVLRIYDRMEATVAKQEKTDERLALILPSIDSRLVRIETKLEDRTRIP